MIDSIKQAIANRLLELYPDHTVYDEDIPQKFKKPSFLIILTDTEHRKRLNTKSTILLSFDLAYFSDKESYEIKNDCSSVQMNLLRSFDLIDMFRIHNKKSYIVDNVLHITFDIKFSETKDEDFIKMQTQQTNTSI